MKLKLLIKEIVKQLIKEDENFAQPLKFWWMDPHNEFHKVKFEEHRYWAEEYLKNHGYPIVDKQNIYGMMYKLGFIRVGKTMYGNEVVLSYQYSKEKILNPKQKSKLKDLAITERCNFLNDEVIGGEIKLDIPVDDIGGVTENMTYDDLLKLTDKTPKSPEDDTSRIDRAKTVRARSIPVTMEENMEQWNFRYRSNPSKSNPESSFEGNITFLKGEVDKSDDAMKLECKVDCGCRDYKYRFAYNNFKQGAGKIGPDSLNKCINRSPQPAYDIGEGLCKHLVALRGYLQTKIAATQKSNLFEALNEVSKQGPFNITYYD